MKSSLATNSTNALTILKNDHKKVKMLFDNFEKTKSQGMRKKIVDEAIQELKIHATLEELIFYPAVRKPIGKEVMNEADEEHHVAKILIAELEQMNGNESHYNAKFKVLAENVRHHIKEEEGEMLPKAKALSVDMGALGKMLLDAKQGLMKTGVAVFAEEKMIAAIKNKGDSPAQAAKRTTHPG